MHIHKIGGGLGKGRQAIVVLRLDELEGSSRFLPLLDVLAAYQKVTHTMVDALEGGYFLKVRKRRANSASAAGQRYCLYMTGEVLYLVCQGQEEERRVQALFEGACDAFASAGHGLCHFLQDLLAEDAALLQELERAMAQLEEEVLAGGGGQFHKQVTPLRRELLHLHTYYQGLMEVGECLASDELGLFEEEVEAKLARFFGKARRFRDWVEVLRQFVLQVQDIYQGQLDSHQNDIMKGLTVLTTIFFPLSLVSSWYGMNFTYMPEVGWKYGYLFVVALSVLLVGTSIWWFGKKGYFDK